MKNALLISALVFGMAQVVHSADLVIRLGSITIPDNAEPGITQQNLKDWLDLEFDKKNAPEDGEGGQYARRLRKAIRAVGIRGVRRGVKRWKTENALTITRDAITAASDIITEEP